MKFLVELSLLIPDVLTNDRIFINFIILVFSEKIIK